MAGNLGFKTYLVADACFTFARRDFNGLLRRGPLTAHMQWGRCVNEGRIHIVDTTDNSGCPVSKCIGSLYPLGRYKLFPKQVVRFHLEA